MGVSVFLLLFLVASETGFSISKNQDVSALAQANNLFGLGIGRILANGDDGNILFSPGVILIALEVMCYGSRGKTPDEIRKVFGYEEAGLTDSKARAAIKSIIETFSTQSESEEYLTHSGRALFTQKNYPIAPEYKDFLVQNYIATVHNVDFQNEDVKTVQEINNCIKFYTNNQIEKLLDDFGPRTTMVLVNAAFIKSSWKTESDPKDTSETVFYNNGLPGKKTKVNTIQIVGEFPFARIGEGNLLELPYTGEDIALILYLPDAMNVVCKAQQFLRVNDALAALKGVEKARFRVSLPIFNLECNITLNSVLQNLGMSLFENIADLKPIIDASPISVLKVVHIADFEIKEGGSAAAAVTGVVTETSTGGGRNKAAPETGIEEEAEDSELLRVPRMVTETKMEGVPDNIVFDRPFLFAVVEKIHGFIYFQGRVCEL